MKSDQLGNASDREEAHRQLRELISLFKEGDAIYGEFAKQSGLSISAFWLMCSIREEDGKRTQKEICDQWAITKQTINSALKGLEKRGYITLEPSEIDRRGKYVILTEKGVKFAQENIDMVFEAEQLAFQKMNHVERRTLMECSRKYHELFRAESERFLKNDRYH
ncbi:MarR family winged helix-turn-helix transcriptional regulator [Methanomassiliicoccus luminyensis]|jgi:DNA-binding MarR family transcriptional regulator|uniref:MarR family winged helix-turn-helix transcriptional regulator n=1 Tax=Methanomassiliicoccus luminyensis TaxID=1080712 RepID=UPI00035F1E99|nr:MarR family transcriptional regulator [Methanomassiliicoccus luminyensis]